MNDRSWKMIHPGTTDQSLIALASSEVCVFFIQYIFSPDRFTSPALSQALIFSISFQSHLVFLDSPKGIHSALKQGGTAVTIKHFHFG
jgi:hypothetical protein